MIKVKYGTVSWYRVCKLKKKPGRYFISLLVEFWMMSQYHLSNRGSIKHLSLLV